jgi:hypothetical protein
MRHAARLAEPAELARSRSLRDRAESRGGDDTVFARTKMRCRYLQAWPLRQGNWREVSIAASPALGHIRAAVVGLSPRHPDTFDASPKPNDEGQRA